MKRFSVLFTLAAVIFCFSQLLAQTSPRLRWDMNGATAAEVTMYQYELWINGTGQLPLRTATCTGTTQPFVCTDANPLPNQPEGTRNLQLLAIGPQGIKSVLSSNFPVTYPSAPANLRFAP